MGHRRSSGGFSGRRIGRLTVVVALMGALLVLSPNAALAADPVANDDSATVVQGGTVTVVDGGASVKDNDTDTEDGVPGGDVTSGDRSGQCLVVQFGRRRHLLLHPQRVDYGPGLFT